jgi:hypothetical protein
MAFQSYTKYISLDYHIYLYRTSFWKLAWLTLELSSLLGSFLFRNMAARSGHMGRRTPSFIHSFIHFFIYCYFKFQFAVLNRFYSYLVKVQNTQRT